MTDTVNKSPTITIGRVVSAKMDKTVVVRVTRKVAHKLYKKLCEKSSKIFAHDEANECQIGDLVGIVQCRPMSKKKSWKVVKIIETESHQL